ncbi:MAG: oligosaccharide flippase family protein [Candidatus Marinimicrobia bacterium]|nr:oligosaccharide flippase family protein [Candidatus Neomarinimicrobiota bacterium]
MLIGFTTQVVLARLLAPEYFGALAFSVMVAFFFSTLANIQGDKYLIREAGDIQEKFNNVFTIEVILATTFSILVIGLAPALMRLLGSEHLTSYVQVLTIAYFYNPFSRVRSLFEKELSFFRARMPMVIAQAVAAGIGILLAYLGFGIWGLVAWRLVTLFTEALVLWWIAPLRPHLALNRDILRDIFRFCWPLMGSAVLIYFYWNIDYYIVARLLDETQLGYYWLAFQMTHYLTRFRHVINTVLFPTFSRIGDDEIIKKIFAALSDITFILFLIPIVILFFYGETVIVFIFGDKWGPATPVFQIFTVVTAFRMIFGYWDPVVLYYGKTKIPFYMTIYGAISLTIFVSILTPRYGITGAAAGVLGSISLGTILYGIIFHFHIARLSYRHLALSFFKAFVVLGAAYGINNVWHPNLIILFIFTCIALFLLNVPRIREYYLNYPIKNTSS